MDPEIVTALRQRAAESPLRRVIYSEPIDENTQLRIESEDSGARLTCYIAREVGDGRWRQIPIVVRIEGVDPHPGALRSGNGPLLAVLLPAIAGALAVVAPRSEAGLGREV